MTVVSNHLGASLRLSGDESWVATLSRVRPDISTADANRVRDAFKLLSSKPVETALLTVTEELVEEA